MKVPTFTVLVLVMAVALFANSVYLPFLSTSSNPDSMLSASPPYHYRLNAFHAPSLIERYTLEHAVELHYHRNVPYQIGAKHTSPPVGCDIWTPSLKRISEYFQTFRTELETYNRQLSHHAGSLVGDIRSSLTTNATTASSSTVTICSSLELHPHGLGGIFSSGSLSRSPHGLLEPVFPPLQSLSVCEKSSSGIIPPSNPLDYLVHDFAATCHQLQPDSKILWFEVGYDVSHQWQQPPQQQKTHKAKTDGDYSSTMALMTLYRKFGFPVDSIYILDSKQQSSSSSQGGGYTSQILQTNLPGGKDRHKSTTPQILPNFQSATTGRTNHPWDFIESIAKPNDLVMVTIRWPPRGVDPTPEIKLVEELKRSSSMNSNNNNNNNNKNGVAPLLDHLYLKANVYMVEDEPPLNDKKTKKHSEKATSSSSKSNTVATTRRWTVQETLYVFEELRRRGIPAHAWV